MLTNNRIAAIGALVGDPTRAAMLVALMDGRALTAGELADVGGITASTASSHLSRLVSAGMLRVERQGRHRYHRVASADIARLLEGLMVVAAACPAGDRRVIRTGPRDDALRFARTCYNHLAGRVAVAIADKMIEAEQLIFTGESGRLTPSGTANLARIGIEHSPLKMQSGRQICCRPCLDWSERRPHLAGAVGAAILRHLREHDWVRSGACSRSLVITPKGQRGLADAFDLPWSLWTTKE